MKFVYDDDAGRMVSTLLSLTASGWELVGLPTRQTIRGEVIYCATLKKF